MYIAAHPNVRQIVLRITEEQPGIRTDRRKAIGIRITDTGKFIAVGIQNHPCCHLDVVLGIHNQIIDRINGDLTATECHLTGIADIDDTGIGSVAEDNSTRTRRDSFIKIYPNIIINFGNILFRQESTNQWLRGNGSKVEYIRIANTHIRIASHIGYCTAVNQNMIVFIKYQVIGRINHHSAITVKHDLRRITDVNRSCIRTITDNNVSAARDNHFIKIKRNRIIHFKN